MTINSRRIRYNKGIRAEKIRLINAEGEQVGIVSLKEGLELASKSDLDLLEISPTTKPPVCKIMDYGKYHYDLKKKEKDNRKKHRNVTVKEIKFSCKIADHDYQTKLKQCEKFLKRGDRVKVTMSFRGREKAHIEIGRDILKRLFDDISQYGEVEKDYGLKGNNIITVLMPK